MNRNFIMAVFCLIISAITFAQVPQKMSYQAVVRGSDNNLVTNSEVSVRVSILQGSAEGEAVYTETHSATTNANGLLTIEIGDGISNDDFSAINWANGPYFVKTETDVNGGNDYNVIAVSQLLAVPYAMYAQTAGNMPDVSGFISEETDPTVPAWAKTENKPVYNYSEIEGTPEIPTVVSAFDNDAAYISTETQTLAEVVSLGNSASNNQIKNLADPTDAQDAVTKSYVDNLIAQIQELINSLIPTTGTLNGHDWIDLGLPSGTRWATCNVGADNPEDYGDFFAWGETTPKTSYTENNYTYSSNSTTLPSSADAASVNWEGAWRMPTKAEFEELNNNCTIIWTTQNGVNGRLFTGPNGNSIFLPATGYYQDSNFLNAGSCGYFWTSSLYTGYMSSAWNFLYTTNACVMANNMRFYGMPIRAVCQPEN